VAEQILEFLENNVSSISPWHHNVVRLCTAANYDIRNIGDAE